MTFVASFAALMRLFTIDISRLATLRGFNTHFFLTVQNPIEPGYLQSGATDVYCNCILRAGILKCFSLL